MLNLREQMDFLVNCAQKRIQENPSISHDTLCEVLAEQFQLYKNKMFPIWLSRVVEGLLLDEQYEAKANEQQTQQNYESLHEIPEPFDGLS